jgi:uncharacterized protein YciW
VTNAPTAKRSGIVTLSQIAAFLSFQIRVVAGLRVLAGRS